MTKRFAFVLWDGGGNVPPAIALGRKLLDRGHSVRFFADATLEGRIETSGCAFVPFRHESSINHAIDGPMSDRRLRLIDLLFGQAVAKSLLSQLEDEAADGIIVDFMHAAALCAAERTGLPTCVLVSTLYSWFTSPRALKRWAPMAPFLEATRRAIGLPPLEPKRTLWDDLWRQSALSLVLTPREFDAPSGKIAPNAHYVGPVIDVDTESVMTPWLEDDAAPLVLISFGTTDHGQVETLQRAIDAMEGLTTRALVTLGGGLTPAALEVPPDILLRDWVPHSSVLPHTSALVTHAGHGTAMTALAFGVPMLCVPNGRDMGDVAARVAACGAGHVLLADANSLQIRDALVHLIETPSYREGARRMAATIERYGNGSRAVEMLETLASGSIRPGSLPDIRQGTHP